MKPTLKSNPSSSASPAALKIFEPSESNLAPQKNSAANIVVQPRAEPDLQPLVREQFSSHARSELLKSMLEMFDRGMRRADIYKALDLSPIEGRVALITARRERVARYDFEFIKSSEFRGRNSEAKILAATWEGEQGVMRKAPPGLPPYLAALYANPLLTREQEQVLFRRMNFEKFRGTQIIKKNKSNELSVKTIEALESIMTSADSVRNILIERNLRLVVSIAKKFTGGGASFFEFVSAANEHLIKAIENFDYGRGYKFSTYATWVIKKNMARVYHQDKTRNTRFRTSADDLLVSFEDKRDSTSINPDILPLAQKIIFEASARLEPREREILMRRAGLYEGGGAQTLDEIGRAIGVTKERVRQIEGKARQKLAALLLKNPEHKEILSRLGAREENLQALHSPDDTYTMNDARERILANPVYFHAKALSLKHRDGFTMADVRTALLNEGKPFSSLSPLWTDLRTLIELGVVIVGEGRNGVPHYHMRKEEYLGNNQREKA